jgi:hypothetical protein
MLLTWHADAVAWLDWYTPWRHVETSRSAVPMIRAASRMSSASTPQMAAAASAVQPDTVSRSFSKPTVCSATNARATQPSAISSCWIAFSSARFVPARIGR